MTSLQYYCIPGLAGTRWNKNLCAKDAGCAGNKITGIVIFDFIMESVDKIFHNYHHLGNLNLHVKLFCMLFSVSRFFLKKYTFSNYFVKQFGYRLHKTRWHVLQHLSPNCCRWQTSLLRERVFSSSCNRSNDEIHNVSCFIWF